MYASVSLPITLNRHVKCLPKQEAIHFHDSTRHSHLSELFFGKHHPAKASNQFIVREVADSKTKTIKKRLNAAEGCSRGRLMIIGAALKPRLDLGY